MKEKRMKIAKQRKDKNSKMKLENRNILEQAYHFSDSI